MDLQGEIMKNLEKLADMVVKGKVSVDRAALQIMETVYRNKNWFGLKKLHGDRLHDFMLFYYERSKQVFRVYDPTQGPFTSYLYVNINNALMAWLKIQQKSQYEEKSLEMLQDMTYEESVCSYQEMEESAVMEISGSEIPAVTKLLSGPGKQDASYSYSRGRKLRTESLEDSRDEKLRKEACLILALKSCKAIGRKMIEKSAAACGKSVQEVERLVEEAKESMDSKNDRITTLEKSRDNFFFYKRKYLAEMEGSDRNSDAERILIEKIDRADEAWKNKNRQLKSESLRVPSNVTVGKLLGMSDRHVRYVIKLAAKNMDNISLKSYYGKHENLFGKRKPEQEEGNG